jgi:hypothetical protein
MFLTSRTGSRRLAPLSLLAAVFALQAGAIGDGAGGPAPSETRIATAIPLPTALPTSDGAGFERLDGDAGAGRPSPVTPDAVVIHTTSAGPLVVSFCPWRARDALARAGRSTSPSTAPPASRV